jgi:four helix bundle protein
MSTLKSFEDLEIWKRARAFSQRIFELSCEGTFAKDFALRNQINDATGSIMDNVAEGFDRGGQKKFIQFLSYAKGSTAESRSQLYRASDRNHITKETFIELRDESITIGKMIGSLMNYLRRSPIRGNKYLP